MSVSFQNVQLFSTRFFPIISIIFLSLQAEAQADFHSVAPGPLTIRTKTIDGYGTQFNYSTREVRKGLWKYCKKFSRLVNEKDHYVIDIPASQNEGNYDFIIYVLIDGGDSISQVRFALGTDNMEEEDIPVYDTQCKDLLMDFKTWFYHEDLQAQIDAMIKQASRLSRSYEKLADENEEQKKQEILNQLTTLEQRIAELRTQQITNAH